MSKVVVLGTAHLASTPGKCSPDKCFREYKYSREICVELQKRLRACGVECYIDYLDDDMPGKNSSQELIERVNLVNKAYCNKFGKDNVFYVSIHVNAAGGDGRWRNATGFAIYTSPGKTKSDDLATCIWNEAERILTPLGKKLRKDMSDGDPDYEENFYVLKKTSCPTVLTENFFQDNKDDVDWLSSEEGKETVVEYHLRGILRYLNLLN